MCPKKSLYIFDFDNTLVTTDCRVVVKRWKQEYFLSPSQYSEYNKEKYDELDMSQFERLIKPRIIVNIFKIFKNKVKDDKVHVMILTARAQVVWEEIREFLIKKKIDTTNIEFIGLDSSDPYKKAEVIENKVRNNSFSELFFYDDCSRVRSAARKVLKMKPVRYKIANPLEI